MRPTRKMRSIATFTALVLAGCSGDGITSPLGAVLDPASVSASRSVERPWKGRCALEVTFTSPTTLLILGTCQLAHLGRTDVIIHQTIVPGPTEIRYTNTTVYTAANGDELHTTNVGSATPTATGLALLGIETAVGGTGRFENATGTANLIGSVLVTATSQLGAYTVDGRLEY